MEKVEVRFEKWIGEGFNLYKENFGVLIVPSLIAMLLSFTGILAGPMMVGLILITFALLDKKEPKPQVGDLFKGFDFFLPSFLFMLVWGLGLYVVYFILMFIPILGWLVAIALSFAVPTCVMFGLFLIVDKKMDFWAASMASFEKVKTNFFPFLLLYLVAAILGGLGAVLCGIGIFLTFPLMVCILAIAYREVFCGAASSAGCCGTCGGTPPAPPGGSAQ